MNKIGPEKTTEEQTTMATAEAAAYVGLSASAFFHHRRKGHIVPSKKIGAGARGGAMEFAKADLDTFKASLSPKLGRRPAKLEEDEFIAHSAATYLNVVPGMIYFYVKKNVLHPTRTNPLVFSKTELDRFQAEKSKQKGSEKNKDLSSET